MVKIVDGKKISNEILSKLKKQIGKLSTKPNLAVILVGNDPASQLYVRIKEKKCQEVGIGFIKYDFADNIPQEKITNLINNLNVDKSISGIIVQLPLPSNFDTNTIISAISPLKDVDGLHPTNLGKLLIGQDSIIPPTPAGIIEILRYYNIKLAGAHIVLVGYGKLVGKPLAAMLAVSQENATVTICNAQTKNLSFYTKQADILISATGTPNLIKAEMIKKDAVVIDAGTTIIKNYELRIMNYGNKKNDNYKNNSLNENLAYRQAGCKMKIENSRVVGDVDFEKVKKVAGVITPPVGGIGPLTVAKLLENVVIRTNQESGIRNNG